MLSTIAKLLIAIKEPDACERIRFLSYNEKTYQIMLSDDNIYYFEPHAGFH